MKDTLLSYLCALATLASASAHDQPTRPTGAVPPDARSIPFENLGSEVSRQIPDAASIKTSKQGVHLAATMQDLEGEVTTEGLWLSSKAAEDAGRANRFRVRASHVGRVGLSGRRQDVITLPPHGVVRSFEDSATYERPGLVEEYRVSGDGVRQDFVVPQQPWGKGELCISLEVDGASAEAALYGAKLTVTATGRELAYSRLIVTDATGRNLPARMEVADERSMRVFVDDADASYPVRIDPTFSDAEWISMGAAPGVNDTVNVLAADGLGNLYVGGLFTAVGGITANRIAKWDGSNWSALGSGMSDSVSALAIYGGELYAGGAFTTAGGASANRIAKWNGSAWSALGAGMDGEVVSMTVMGADLYVGGGFTTADGNTVNRVAKWNGSAWSALGSGCNAYVYALAVFGGELHAAGQFSSAGGVAVSRIAKWNGSIWSGLGAGVNDIVYTLCPIGSDLYAGGRFDEAGGQDANNVARWNGSTWSPLGTGLGFFVHGSAAIGSDLYVAGRFSTAGGVSANRLAKWNGSTWSALGSGASGNAFALAVIGSDLYAGGEFTSVGGQTVNRIGKWDGTAWSPLGGTDARVQAITLSGGDLYVGGQFTRINGVLANRVAKWNGSTWSALGTGVDDMVLALAVVGSDLYVGGDFDTAGGLSSPYIARWNGSAWSTVGGGLSGGSVEAFAVMGTDLYAGGSFFTAGGQIVNNVAKWNGVSWAPLANGTSGDVHALAVRGNELYVGGYFRTISSVTVNNIARWNGSAWSAVGTGMGPTDPVNDGEVFALTVVGNDLYAGGFFTTAGGSSANYVARWNGSAWSNLGTGMNSAVYALAGNGSEVFVGGGFTTAGGTSANRVALWNGSTWSAMGSGTDNTVFALAVNGSALYAGGNFNQAGGKISTSLARGAMGGPSLTLGSASAVTNNSATLHGTVNPNGQVTTAQFQYGLTAAYGSSASVTLTPNNGSAPQAVSANIASLTQGTLYHYRLTATNGDGTRYTYDGSFSTIIPGPEIAVEQPAGTDRADGGSAGFGAVNVGVSVTQTYTIRNMGTTNLTGLSVTKDGSHAAEFVVGALGATTLTPGATTTFDVTHTPAGIGLRSAAIHIASNDANENPFDLSLSSVGVSEPEIAVEQPLGTDVADGGTVNFGTVETGSSTTLTFTIKNSGLANLSVSSFTKNGTNASEFTVTGLDAVSIAQNGTRTFTVRFTPEGAGARTAAIHITNGDSNESPFDINFTGTGNIPPGPEIDVEQPAGTDLADGASLLNFGSASAGGANVRTITVKNAGASALTGLSVTKSGTHAADYTVSALGSTTLAAGASTTFNVTFSPAAGTNTRTASIHIASNDANENPFDIALTGQFVLTSEFTSAAAITIPSVGNGTPYPANLTVSGVTGTVISVRAKLNGVTHSYPDDVDVFLMSPSGRVCALMSDAGSSSSITSANFVFSDDAGSTLPDASQLTSGTFRPTNFQATEALPPGGTGAIGTTLLTLATGGVNGTWKLFVSDDDSGAAGSIASWSLEFDLPAVNAPDIAVERPAGTPLVDGAATVDFGSLSTGNPNALTFTVKNEGTANLTGLAITKTGTNATEYSVGALGATTLAPGASTTFTVTFTPAAAGTRTAALRIASNDTDENPFDINLTGVGVVAPEIAVEQPVGTNLTDGVSAISFESPSAGTATTQVFRIKNTGSAALTGLAISIDGSNAADFSVTANPTAPVAGPSGFTSFTVRFLPLTPGAKTAALHIASNDSDENPFDIALSGTSVADTVAPPAPTIAAPAADALINLTPVQQVTISGTATDNKAVKQVQISLNGGSFVDATLATPNAASTGYTLLVTPTGGVNTIAVKTIDYGDLSSPIANRSFRVGRHLQVLVNPQSLGTVTAGFEGNSFREVGKSVSVTATPKPPTGVLQPGMFAGWTIGGQDVAMGGIPFTLQRLGIPDSARQKQALTFTFREGLILTANFVASPFYSVSGTYYGLIETDTADSDISANSTEGFITATVQNTGAFSGKLNIDGLVLNVAGAFDSGGFARFGTARQTKLTLARPGKPSLVVELFGLTTFPFDLVGTVTQTGFQRSDVVAVSSIRAERAYFGAQVLPASIVAGQPTVTVVDASGRAYGESVTGTGIQAGTIIQNVNSNTQLTLSKNATATNAAASLTFTRDVDPFYLGTAGANGTFTTILPPKQLAHVRSGYFDDSTDFFDPGSPNDFSDGDEIRIEDFSGTPPELLTDSIYFVLNKTGDAFQIRSLGSGPAPVDFSTSGLGRVILLNRQTEGFDTSDYPQGHGIGTFSVSKAGLVTFAGTLADGTAISTSSALTEFEPWSEVALYASLYGAKGFLSGYVRVDNSMPEADMAATDLKWMRPEQTASHYYPHGWPEVLKVDLLAAKYLVTTGQSALKAPDGADGNDLGDTIQGADEDGNATLVLDHGALSQSLQKTANVSITDLVTKVPDNDPTFTLTINRTTGAINGTFDHTDDTKPLFNGILYQKGLSAGGHGFFLTKQPTVIDFLGESGNVYLIGQP